MTSQVDVVNRALSRLGSTKRIADLDEATKEARVASLFYDATLDELLARRQWTFAVSVTELAARADDPPPGWDHMYGLPGDCVQVIGAYWSAWDEREIRYELQHVDGTRVLVANTEPVYCRYTRRVTDPELMTPLFREAFELLLAARMAFDLTAAGSRVGELEALATRSFNRAASRDAMESHAARLHRGSWHDARGGRRGVWGWGYP